jgi:hypothetical protein
MREEGNVYKVLVGKPEAKTQIGRSKLRLENGIRMDLTEIGWEDIERVQLAQNRGQWRAVVNAEMNLRILAPRSYLVT